VPVSLANSRASRLCVHPFDPLSAPCGSREWIRKVLCFPRNLVVLELHDAHRVGRLPVICQDEFGDPKITAANDSSDTFGSTDDRLRLVVDRQSTARHALVDGIFGYGTAEPPSHRLHRCMAELCDLGPDAHALVFLRRTRGGRPGGEWTTESHWT
jgi:hypothetical protein